MNDCELGKEMYDRALAFINKRYDKVTANEWRVS